jgi:hypothetical protein
MAVQEGLLRQEENSSKSVQDQKLDWGRRKLLTFVPSTSELGEDQTFRRPPTFLGVASLAIRNLETSHT